MKLFNDTKIYIACPGNSHTGGPELLHQLGSLLCQFGLDAYMFYTSRNSENPVDDFYFKYHVPYVLKVEDTPHNVIILFEAIGSRYFESKNMQKIFWWLSVDNYAKNISDIISARKQNYLLAPMPKFFYFQETEKDTEHWVQSEYARQFIMLNGVHEKNIYMVEDYLNQAFLNKASKVDLAKKENIVVFNPRKGFEVTRKLISFASDIKWIPIQNMTPEQVQSLLSKAKIYIDFGNHPGKDRIPREAAISGCVVITGKRGAAANDIDINIPPEFKFDVTDKDLPLIIEKIRDVFENFNDNYLKQKAYRERIFNDKERFEKEVADAFNLKSSEKINSAAIWQGYHRKSIQILNIIEKKNFDLQTKFVVDDRLGKGQKLRGEFLKRNNHCNYFSLKNTEIPFISVDDAKFLYLEGRIKKFLLLMPEESELNELFQKVNPKKDDVVILISKKAP